MKDLDDLEVNDLILIGDLISAIAHGFDYDPGHSDLDDEQPIHVQMTLGDYRSACRVLRVSPYKVTQ